MFLAVVVMNGMSLSLDCGFVYVRQIGYKHHENVLVVNVEQRGVQILLPAVIDLVVGRFYLICEDRRNFPSGIKGQCLVLRDRRHQKIIEKMPLTVCWSCSLGEANYWSGQYKVDLPDRLPYH